ncbi:MAG: polymer-forming cytoskeletal protein [Gemmatimonadota bacterium]|nr:polymer-forming cytoskeletal protein [Gemmatimonadota bacterium]MDH3368680.1 polymer-forming cytoskeletal protein [Gemmatimonadota bacterium]MDH3479717.1 polymer-forming cytoskeletal protein [Gemmatimonadota bacterium]MDH3569085.1 polymer-forming cytoskeletal protein [Gemmatimonadota bacterium]MDH5551621.1 polymer-forming cytoskeletal protein [Gemmatimonadota bacterium]
MTVFSPGKNGSRFAFLPDTTGQAVPLSILAHGVRLTGTLETSGVVRVEGEVNGDLRVKGGQVLVAAGGVVEGDVEAALAVIAGEVRGHIVAEELVELKTGSTVYGDITTPRISVEDGGAVNGTLRMTGQRQQGNGWTSPSKNAKGAGANGDAVAMQEGLGLPGAREALHAS